MLLWTHIQKDAFTNMQWEMFPWETNRGSKEIREWYHGFMEFGGQKTENEIESYPTIWDR